MGAKTAILHNSNLYDQMVETLSKPTNQKACTNKNSDECKRMFLNSSSNDRDLDKLSETLLDKFDEKVMNYRPFAQSSALKETLNSL